MRILYLVLLSIPALYAAELSQNAVPSAPQLINHETNNLYFAPGRYILQSKQRGPRAFKSPKYVTYRKSILKWRNRGAMAGGAIGGCAGVLGGLYYAFTTYSSYVLIGGAIVAGTGLFIGVAGGMVLTVSAYLLLHQRGLVLSSRQPVEWILDGVGDDTNGFTLRAEVGRIRTSEKYIAGSRFKKRGTRLNARKRLIFHATGARDNSIYLQTTFTGKKSNKMKKWFNARGRRIFLGAEKISRWQLHQVSDETTDV